MHKDIGFVHEQQPAEVKVETFPFIKYGTIDAEIINVSNDAVTGGGGYDTLVGGAGADYLEGIRAMLRRRR